MGPLGKRIYPTVPGAAEGVKCPRIRSPQGDAGRRRRPSLFPLFIQTGRVAKGFPLAALLERRVCHEGKWEQTAENPVHYPRRRVTYRPYHLRFAGRLHLWTQLGFIRGLYVISVLYGFCFWQKLGVFGAGDSVLGPSAGLLLAGVIRPGCLSALSGLLCPGPVFGHANLVDTHRCARQLPPLHHPFYPSYLRPELYILLGGKYGHDPAPNPTEAAANGSFAAAS